MFNIYLLEKKIATVLGYKNTRDIYKEMERRQKILDKLVENEIFNYFEVWEVLKKFKMGGVSALPFEI